MSDFDPELWVMRYMSADELERFTGILETIEKEDKWAENFKSEVAPDVPLPAKERAAWWAHMNRWESAMREKNAILHKYANQSCAWVKLIDYSLAAIESLFDQGKLNREVTDRTEFWCLVYHRILSDRGAEIGRDPKFRNVKILEILKHWVDDCLPGFAERFREKGNPILAQTLEALAERGK